jgi:FkbM family methyltransferase
VRYEALLETREAASRYRVGAVVAEAWSIHRGFANWLALLGAIGVGRVRGCPPGLDMRARAGPNVRTPAGDRSWRTVVECFGCDNYHLASCHLPPAPVVIDVGANIGAFALAVLALRPEARVAAYEASPLALATLRENVASNRSEGAVTVHHAAVTGLAEPPTVWLYEHIGDLCTSSLLDQGPVTAAQTGDADAAGLSTPKFRAERTEVPAVALSEILASEPQEVDLLKIDVEGAEYAILKATPLQLLGKVRRLVLEYHRVPGHDIGELAERLGQAGLCWERHERSTLPYQGMGWWVKPPHDW